MKHQCTSPSGRSSPPFPFFRQCLWAFVLTGAALPLKAQLLLNRQVTASTGGSNTVDGLLIQYTIGDVAVKPVSSGALLFTQGFQQPEELPPVKPGTGTLTGFILFPNPAATTLKIQFDLQAAASVTFLLVNSAGQVMHQELRDYGAGKVLITTPVNRLAAGIYTVILKVNGYVFKEKVIVQ